MTPLSFHHPGAKPAAVAFLLLFMAACGVNDAKSADPATVIYRGETLHCVTFSNGYGDTASCDFVRFYAEHPDLLDAR